MASLERIDLDDMTILKLKGTLCSEGLEQVQEPFEEIANRPGSRLIIDLTHVDLLTTPAISMFVAAANAQAHSGGRIVFTESPPPVRDILRRLRLQTVLRTVTGLTEAISEVRGEPTSSPPPPVP